MPTSRLDSQYAIPHSVSAMTKVRLYHPWYNVDGDDPQAHICKIETSLASSSVTVGRVRICTGGVIIFQEGFVYCSGG